jgi:hypothetical protein
MPLKKLVVLFIFWLLPFRAANAFETDQYNLPPAPLADIGSEVTEYTRANLQKAIDKINAEILRRQNCLENNRAKIECGSPEKERARLDFLRSEDAVIKAVYNRLGAGFIPFTKAGTWINSHRFSNLPARYTTDYQKSIYAIIPTNYLTISPTVNLYGAQFGTDKIAHFFQQGFDYYKIYKRALAQGLTADAATKKAIRWGKMTERTYFGTLVSGVYSNADMSANFVGMKFYQGLTNEIKVGNKTRPPIFVLRDGVWKFNEKADLPEILIKPFMTDHHNEALNPSKFVPVLRSFVRRVVRKQSCNGWRKQFPNHTAADFDKIASDLRLWHGEDYGFSDSKNFITVANTCFGEKSRNSPETE